MYLPQHTFPVQLQTEVHKYLDTWLKQGIICPLCSPYALQVVIVCKKIWGDMLMYRLQSSQCHYHSCSSFPLPHIEEALQAVISAMWFTSFNLAQGCLQLAMDEADINKTAFCAGSVWSL